MAEPDFTLEFSGDKIMDSLNGVFREANEAMTANIVKEATDSKWAWPTNPSPRDVVDKNANGFRSSIKGEGEPPSDYVHSINVKYALAVVKGYKLASGFIGPARDVFKAPLEGLPKDFYALAETAIGKLE